MRAIRARASPIKNRKRLKNLLDAGPTIIYTCKPSSDYPATFVSDNVTSRLGYEAREFLEDPKFWRKHIHPEDAPRVLAELSGLLERGFHVNEYRFLHKDGTYRWMYDEFRLLLDETGHPVEVVGHMTDISQCKRAEELAWEAQIYAESIVETIREPLLVLDENGRVVSANRSFYDTFQTSRSKTENLPIYELANHQWNIPRLRVLLEEVIPTNTVFHDFEVTHTFPGIGTKPMLLNARRMERGKGRPYLILLAIEDISERKRAEAARKEAQIQLQHTQKLESLGILAGGIAHDFNNLLTGILGNADLALMKLPSESPVKSYVQQIQTGALRAAELTKQMLAYSGKGKFVIEPVNLSRLVEDTGDLLRISISKKAVLKYILADNLPSIEADVAQIRQVVFNLILNASEALGDRGGGITVTTAVSEVDRAYLNETYLGDDLPDGFYVSLEVSDTGCGMGQETKAKIFDPFFSTKFSGRGLGLAAVLGIVRGQRGAINIYSQPGRGTTFKILFPASEKPTREIDRSLASTKAWQGAGTILVVDDEETVRSVAKMMLEQSGFAVLTASDGREAVEVFSKYADEIVAVLLDMTMPYLSGEEVFREIRRIRLDARVILSSGYNEQDVTSDFVGMGLAGFIQKPYQLSKLIEKVREALDPKPRPTQ